MAIPGRPLFLHLGLRKKMRGIAPLQVSCVEPVFPIFRGRQPVSSRRPGPPFKSRARLVAPERCPVTGLVMQRTIRISAQRGLDDEDQNPLHPITRPIWWRAQPPAMPRVRAQASWKKPTISRISASSSHVVVSREVGFLFYDDA
jgi:hypothetical protein